MACREGQRARKQTCRERGRVAAHPAVVEAEKVQPLPTFCQVHDPCLGLLELEPELGQDRRERQQRSFGFLSAVAERQQIVGLCRVSGYAERTLGSPVVAGVGC